MKELNYVLEDEELQLLVLLILSRFSPCFLRKNSDELQGITRYEVLLYTFFCTFPPHSLPLMDVKFSNERL